MHRERRTPRLDTLGSELKRPYTSFKGLVRRTGHLDHKVPPFSIVFIYIRAIQVNTQFLLEVILYARHNNRNNISKALNSPRTRNSTSRRRHTNSPRRPPTRTTSRPTTSRQHRYSQRQPRRIVSTLMHTTNNNKHRNNSHNNNSKRHTRLTRHPRRCNGHRPTP